MIWASGSINQEYLGDMIGFREEEISRLKSIDSILSFHIVVYAILLFSIEFRSHRSSSTSIDIVLDYHSCPLISSLHLLYAAEACFPKYALTSQSARCDVA